MYINTFKYTPKDVSCQLCTEYVKKLGCTALRCPWLAERIEAGVVGYREAVLETFPHERRLFQRLNLLIKHYPGSLWSNEQHERRMQYQCAVQGYRRRRDTIAKLLEQLKNDRQKHQYSKANPHGKMTVKQLAAKDKGLQSITNDFLERNYCPTGKKKGCAHPVMLKESSLINCVRDSLKAYIGNIASLEALLTGIDQTSINQALAKEYSDHITDNERRLEQVLEFKARLYESLVGGMLTKEEYASYKAKYTKQAEDIRESVRVLKEKLTEVLENRSERNRWISQFTQFSTLETLDRRALIHMVQSIRVRGKKELDIAFTHEDEYEKALRLLALAAQQKDYEQRKVG